MRLMQLRFTDVLPPHHGSEKVRKYPLYHSSSGVYSGLISYVDHISTREMGGGEGSEFIGRVFFDSSRVVPTAQEIRLVNRAVLYREPSYLKTQEGRQVREHLPSIARGLFRDSLAGTHIPTRQPLTVLSTVRGVALSSGLFLAQELVHQPVKQPDKGNPNSGLCSIRMNPYMWHGTSL